MLRRASKRRDCGAPGRSTSYAGQRPLAGLKPSRRAIGRSTGQAVPLRILGGAKVSCITRCIGPGASSTRSRETLPTCRLWQGAVTRSGNSIICETSWMSPPRRERRQRDDWTGCDCARSEAVAKTQIPASGRQRRCCRHRLFARFPPRYAPTIRTPSHKLTGRGKRPRRAWRERNR